MFGLYRQMWFVFRFIRNNSFASIHPVVAFTSSLLEDKPLQSRDPARSADWPASHGARCLWVSKPLVVTVCVNLLSPYLLLSGSACSFQPRSSSLCIYQSVNKPKQQQEFTTVALIIVVWSCRNIQDKELRGNTHPHHQLGRSNTQFFLLKIMIILKTNYSITSSFKFTHFYLIFISFYKENCTICFILFLSLFIL